MFALKKAKHFSLVIFLEIVFCFFVGLLYADPARAFAISPPLVQIEAEAGDSLIQKISLFNDVDKTIAVYPTVENFIPFNATTGTNKNVGENLDIQNPKDWIKLMQDKIVLEPKEKKDVLVNIKITDLAEPGGYYAAIFWSDAPAVGGINTANRIATLFFFKIKGEVKEKLIVNDFAQEDLSGSVKKFEVTLENQGNVHLQPSGQLKIFNWRHEQVNLIALNPLKQFLLPQSRRTFEIVLPQDSGLFFGSYYAEAKIFYGKDNQEITTTQIKFWVLPKFFFSWLISVGIGIILILIVWKIARQKSSQK